MSLILKRNGHTPDPDRFLVYSGKAGTASPRSNSVARQT
jgi:hypothetical protein